MNQCYKYVIYLENVSFIYWFYNALLCSLFLSIYVQLLHVQIVNQKIYLVEMAIETNKGKYIWDYVFYTC